jgi:hypothetical protein
MTVAALSGAALLNPMAQAHHGFTGRYDVSQPLWIEGQVRDAYFGQPHPTLTIATPQTLAAPANRPELTAISDVIASSKLVVRDDTLGQTITIEFPPTRAFFNLGSAVKVGDTVRVVAFRNCEAPHQLRGQWVLPETGPAIARSGRVQYQVEGC